MTKETYLYYGDPEDTQGGEILTSSRQILLAELAAEDAENLPEGRFILVKDKACYDRIIKEL